MAERFLAVGIKADVAQIKQELEKVRQEVERTLKAMPTGMKDMSGAMKQQGEALKSLSGDVRRAADAMNNLTASQQKMATATRSSFMELLHLKGGIRGYIKDLEMMIAIQMRWYGARMILFAGVGLPVSVIKSGIEYATLIDEWTGKLLRWGATSGQVTEQMRTEIKALVLDVRRAILEIPLSFEEAMKAIEPFLSAGVSTQTVRAITKEILQLAAAFPEIKMETFAVALTGSINTFRGAIKGATTDADAFRVVIEQLLRAQAVGIIRPEQFTKVLQYMGEMAKLTGFTTEQMFALSVAVTDTGVQASRAARLISSIWGAITQPKAMNLLQTIGIEIKKDIPLADQFMKIMTQLKEKLGVGSATTVRATSFLSGLVDKDQQKILLAIMDTLGRYGELIDDIAKATGGLAASTKTKTETIKGQWILLTNTLREVSMSATLTNNVLKDLVITALDFARGLLAATDTSGQLGLNINQLGTAGQIAYGVMKGIVDTITALSVVIKIALEPLNVLFTVLNSIFGSNVRLREAIELLVNIISARLIVALLSKITVLNSLVVILFSAKTATQALTLALGLLSKSNLIAIGIGILVTALMALKDKAEEARKEMEAFKKSVEFMTQGDVKSSTIFAEADMIAFGKAADNLKSAYPVIKEWEVLSKDTQKLKWSFLSLDEQKAIREYERYMQRIVQDKQKIEVLSRRNRQIEQEAADALKKQQKDKLKVDIPEKAGKQYHNMEISALKQYWSAVLQIEKDNEGLQLSQLDNMHKLGLISTEDYYDEKLISMEAYLIEAEKYLEFEKTMLSGEYAEKLTSAKTDQERKAIQEQYDAMLMVMEQKENVFTITRIKAQNDRDTQIKLLAKKNLLDLYQFESNLAQINIQKQFETVTSAYEVEEMLNQNHYDHMLISATGYYKKNEEIIKGLADAKKTALEKSMQDETELTYKQLELAGLNNEQRTALANKLYLAWQKYYADVEKIDEDTLKKILQNNLKAAVDIRKIWEEEGFAGVSKQAIKDVEDEWNDYGKKVYELNKNTYTECAKSFSNLFYDAVTGKLKSLKDYFTAIFQSILRYITDWAGQMATQMVFRPIIQPILAGVTGIAGLFSPGLAQGAGTGLLGSFGGALNDATSIIGSFGKGLLGSANDLIYSFAKMGIYSEGFTNFLMGVSKYAGPVLGVIGGAYGIWNAYQTRNPVQGAISGAIGGAMVGGPIGAIVGGIIGLVAGLVGKKKQLPEAGLAFHTGTEGYPGKGWSAGITAGEGGFAEGYFKNIGLDKEAKAIADMFIKIRKTSMDTFEGLGMDISGFYKDWNYYIGDLTGKSAEDIQKAFETAIASYIQFASGLDFTKWQKSGETLSDTVNRIMSALVGINKFGQSIDDMISAIKGDTDVVMKFKEALDTAIDNIKQMETALKEATDPADAYALAQQLQQAIYETYQAAYAAVKGLINALQQLEEEAFRFAFNLQKTIDGLRGTSESLDMIYAAGQELLNRYFASTDLSEKLRLLQLGIEVVNEGLALTIQQIQESYDRQRQALEARKEAINEEISNLREQLDLVKAWSSVLDSVKKQISELVTSPEYNPADYLELLGYKRQEIEKMQALYAGATGEEKAGYATQLQSLISEYLKLGQQAYQFPSPEYMALYKESLDWLSKIQADAEMYSQSEEEILAQIEALEEESKAIDEQIKSLNEQMAQDIKAAQLQAADYYEWIKNEGMALYQQKIDEMRTQLAEILGDKTAEQYLSDLQFAAVSELALIRKLLNDVAAMLVPGFVPQYASGGYVPSSGMAYLHAGEEVIPTGGRGTSSVTQHIVISPQITINGGENRDNQDLAEVVDRVMIKSFKKGKGRKYLRDNWRFITN